MTTNYSARIPGLARAVALPLTGTVLFGVGVGFRVWAARTSHSAGTPMSLSVNRPWFRAAFSLVKGCPVHNHSLTVSACAQPR